MQLGQEALDVIPLFLFQEKGQEKMKKKVFTTSIRVLIVLLLAEAVLVPKQYSQTAMTATMVSWLAAMGMACLFRYMKNIRKGRPAWVPAWKEKKGKVCAIPVQDGQKADNEAGKNPAESVASEHELELMMQQIALRISEKLKSAYPDAVWQWSKKATLAEILHGTTVRIKVENMASYSHADITFDRFGRIRVEPLTMGSFDPAQSAGNTEEAEPEPSVVDVRAWYELIGQKILEAQIVELNANGHSKLVIKDNGDIMIHRQKKEALVTTMEAFPGRTYWDELVSILEENELKAKIAGDTLQVSWIM